MATDEVKVAADAVEQPQPAAEEAAKPGKEKKPKTPREKKPKTASHPPYFQMIKEALLAMNEKSGSSPYAIAKYMEEKHKAVLPSNFRKMLGLQLKNSAARGKLIKIRASYKLTEEIKQTGKKTTVKREEKKDNKKSRSGSRRKTRSVNKKMESKKGKKSSGGNKPKQPKSIKRTRKPASVIASAS